ncbi:MAG: RNA 2',3'-cyclic phosphodiesterase [Nanoarchaeota archaeon]
MVRAFIAVVFGDEVIKEIARIQEILSGHKFLGKMSELENLHVTLKFLGEIDDEKLMKVREKLKEVKMEEFEAHLDSIGTFNYRGNPKIVWVKIAGKGMFELQKQVDWKMREEGFIMEERFMSHLTIARTKYTYDAKGFMKYVSGIGVRDIKFPVSKFLLLKSDLKPNGPVYNVIEEYDLS